MRISLEFVYSDSQCGFVCLKFVLCFFYNLVVVFDVNGELFCELFLFDKYNNMDKFIESLIFYYFSIWVSINWMVF